MFVVIILICIDVCWHIWEYRERKYLNRCWESLFNDKLESDQRWISLFSKFLDSKKPQKKETQ